MSISSSHRRHSNDVLFCFNTLIDSQIGIVKALQEDFLLEGFSNPNIDFLFLSYTDDIYMEHRMHSMDAPLVSKCFKGNAKDSYMDICKEYMDTQYNRILSLSPKTNMCRLIEMYIKSGVVKPVVLCNSMEESVFTSELIAGKVDTVVMDTDKVNLHQYARITISDIRDILKFRDVNLMNIAVLNYADNFTIIDGDRRILIPEIVLLLDSANSFDIIDPYTIKDKSVG